jgi:hypothetical protein
VSAVGGVPPSKDPTRLAIKRSLGTLPGAGRVEDESVGTPNLPDGPDAEPITQQELHRLVATRARLHTLCGRAACRRGHECAEKLAPCFVEFLPLLREFVFPALRAEVMKERGLTPEPPSQQPVEGRIDKVVGEMIRRGYRR